MKNTKKEIEKKRENLWKDIEKTKNIMKNTKKKD